MANHGFKHTADSSSWRGERRSVLVCGGGEEEDEEDEEEAVAVGEEVVVVLPVLVGVLLEMEEELGTMESRDGAMQWRQVEQCSRMAGICCGSVLDVSWMWIGCLGCGLGALGVSWGEGVEWCSEWVEGWGCGDVVMW